jgi:hypothetical protein
MSANTGSKAHQTDDVPKGSIDPGRDAISYGLPRLGGATSPGRGRPFECRLTAFGQS